MMRKIVSFIIPSYNVERYLKKALDSFFSEEILGKIEVIVVDDGSTDRTAEIAKEYVERVPEVYRLLQKENGGHGSAINEGTRIATGKYVKIVDADDWVVTENLPVLIEKLETCDADVVLNPFHMVDMKTGIREIRCMYLEKYDKVYTLDDVMKEWRAFEQCLTFHGLMYKREFYENNRHELPEGIFYEDQEYASIPCCHAKTIQAMDLFLYQYLIGNGDQSVAVQNQLKRVSHIERVALNMLEYYVKYSDLSDSGKQYLLKKTESICLIYYTIANIANTNKKEGRAWSKAFNHEIELLNAIFFGRIRKKYFIYLCFNCLHIEMEGYKKILNSNLYNFIQKKHQRKMVEEKEQ